MEEENKESEPHWKIYVIFGMINLLLVILAMKLNIILISTALIFLLLIGMIGSVLGIKENWQNDFKMSALGCVMGLLVNCFAAAMYVTGILSGFIEIFSRFLKQ